MAPNNLNQPESFYKGLFNQISQAYVLVDVMFDKHNQSVDALYLDANAIANQMAGVKLPGKRIKKIYPNANPTLFEFLGKVVLTGISEMIELFFEPDNTYYRIHACKASPLHDGKVALIYEDISERKAKETALFESEKKYQALFNSIDEGFGVIEMLYNEDGKPIDYLFHEVNNIYETLTGQFNPSGKLGSEVSPNIEPHWLDTYDRVIQTGEPVRHESYHGDTGRWYSAFASRVGAYGSRMITVVFDDITERKLAEKRQGLLLHISDSLGMAKSLQDVQIMVTNSLLGYYDAGWCYYVEWDDEKNSGVVLQDSKRDDLLSLAGIHDVSDVPEFLEILKSGLILNVNDYKDYELLSPRIRERYIAVGFRSMLVVSLVRQGKLISSLIIGDTKIRDWSRDDETLLADVAERTWAAVERGKAEEALQKSEERLQLALQATNLAVYEWNLVSDQLTTNQRFRELLRYGSNEPVIGERVMEFFVHPDDRLHVDPDLAWAMNPESTGKFVFEHRLNRTGPLGEPWVLSHGQVFFAGPEHDRKPVSVFGTLQKITERKQAEEALRASEQRFQSIANLVPDLLWDSEPDGSANWYNHRWLEYTGQSFAEAIGLGWLNVIHPDDREASARRYAEAVTAGQPLHQEHRIRRHDGEYRWFVVNASPVKDEYGKVIKMYGAATDFHDRKMVEFALQKSEEKYRSLFESIDEGYCLIEVILNAQGEPVDEIFLELNSAYKQLTGRGDEIIGKRTSEVAPNRGARWLKFFGDVVLTGKTGRVEYYAPDVGLWLSTHASRVGGPGSLKIAVVFDDITERKQRELNQDFLLKFSDLLRTELTAGAVAHRALQLLIDHMQLDRSYITSYYLDENRAEVDYQLGNENVPLMPDQFVLSDYPEAFKAVFDETFVIEDELERRGLSEAEIQNSGRLGMRAMVAATVRKGSDHPLWSMVAISSRPRRWTVAEIKLVEEVAERTWSAMERVKVEEALKIVQVEHALQLENEVRERTVELQESRDRLSSILDTTLIQMSVLSAIRDEQGQILDLEIKAVNRELEKETGRQDLVGKRYAEEYPGIRQSGLFELIVKAIKTGEPQSTEYFYPHEGFHKWFACMFVKLGDGVVATNMDISARKLAEEERLKSYVLLQQSEELALMGSWDFNLLNSAFTWSDGMFRLFDVKQGVEIKPEIYLEYATKASRPTAERIIKHLREGDTDFEETLEIKVSGKIKVIHLKASVIYNEEGHPTRVLGVDLDISAMQAAEEKMRKMEAEQQLEVFRVSLNNVEEERQRISESLHNGIGQLLYGIKLSLSNVNLNSDQQNFDSAKKYTNKLLTDAIAETRRISHELMPTTLQEFGLKSAIDDVCRQLSDGVQFQCRITGLYGRLDKYLELAVYRTVQELMTNVVKHAKATESMVFIRMDKQNIKIMVSDNGQGMDDNPKQKLGIGLSSIRSKIRLLNGSVSVQSKVGEGTTIEVLIPALKNKF